MTVSQLRRQIKKAIDSVPADRLASLADYAEFLARPELKKRLGKAERDFTSKKGTAWRSVRRDV
jgi:hypothetical protein